MRNSQINTQVLDKREYVLMRNRREELELIPTDYITEYYSKKDDVSTLTLEIPSKVRRGELEVDYPLYDHFQPRRHITVKLNGEVIERFTVESINIEDSNNFKIKRITAYGYDNILKTKSCLIGEGLTRQLYLTEDEEVHVGEGILNIFEEQTGWKVNHIDELAMKEQVTENVTVTKELMGAKTYEKVEDNMVLFEKDFTVPSEENFPLNFDIAWLDLVVTTTDGFKYESGSIIHTFTDYPTGVTKIKATFTSDSTQRYGITYEITLDNGETSKVTYAFTNCRKLKLETKGINLTYQTSQEEEKMATKYRYLEHSQSYWYQYLKTTVQEAFGVYIRFNTHNKTIDVFNEEQFGQWKGFHLDFDNLLSKINKQPNMSELCTRLWIQSNSVDITEVNPLGTSYLEDYSYFEQSGTMSESLSSALKRYYAHVEVKQVEWLEVSKLKNSTDQWLTKRNGELTSLNEQVKAKQAILTAYLKDKDNEEGQKRVAQELKELEKQVSQKLSQIETLKAQSDEYLSQMQLIGKQMAKETSEDSQGKIFTNVDLEELDDITIEQTYTDDYYTKAKGLFEYGKTLMKDKATLRYTFTLEHKDLAQNIKHPLGWEWFIELGAKVEIADKDIANKDGFITIYAYKYSPKTKQMTSVEFDNNSAVIKAVSGIASFSKIAHNTANMTDFWKHTWVEADKATAIVSDIRKNGLDLASNMVRGGNTVNKISMTESGIFVIDAENEDNQVYIGASLIAITDDRWITSKTAISQGGILADSIVGRLILGEKLFISNEDGSFEILPNGLTIRDELGKEQVSLGIDDKKNPFLHLGIKDESKNHLIFNADGTLDIKASSIKLMTGDVVSKEEMEEIANNVANKVDLAIRNYALDTVMHKTLTGNGNNEQVISLYELSQDGTTFMDKEVTLTFKYTTTLESQGSFFVRTGSNHYQALTDVIVIGSETRQGKVVKTVTITKEASQSFSDLELVAQNFTGEITISMLKFSLGNKATDWTPAPEDSDASYSVILTNESQVIPTTTSLKPLSNSQYTTQVIVYQGTKQQTNFKIKPLVAKDGITPSINGDTITFSVNKNTILSANQGQFEIQIEIDKKVFTKMWTWATASQGQDGAIGENAKQVVVTGEQVFKYQNDFSGNPLNLNIRLTATLFHTSGCQWSYRTGNGNPTNISGATSTTLDVQHNASYWGEHKQLVFRCTSNDGVFDEMTIVKVSDGMNGEGSYTVFLTNENHSFPCESNGNIPVSLETTTHAVVFKGTKKVTPTIGNILKPDGLSVRVGTVIDNEVPIVITALAGNELGLGGNVAIPIIVDGQEFEKSFTYSKAKSGEKGEDGSNASYITITGEQFFKYGKDGLNSTPTPSQIVLTAQRTNLSGRGDWQYLEGNIWRNLNVNTDTLTVTPNMGTLANSATCSFRFIVDGNYDVMTIAKLVDGEGAKYVVLSGEQAFKYQSNFTGAPTPSSITLNAMANNIKNPIYKWSFKRANEIEWNVINGATNNSYSLAHDNITIFNSNDVKSITLRCTINDDVYDEMTIVKVSDGADGEPYTVILSNESHAFPCASNGNVTNAISINTTAIAYKGATSVVPTIGTLPSVNGLTLSKNGAVVTIQANTGTSLADSGTVNIPVVVDGKTFTKVFSWTKAKSGVNGANGYTILLDNENFTFQASSTGNITSQIQTTTTATVYQGTVQKTPTIGNLPTVNGLTLTKNGATVTIVAKTGTALAEQGEFAIPIIVDNQTFTRKFTWTKARSGAEAQYVVVNGEQVFRYANNFIGTPTPNSITLNANKINISKDGKWQYKNADGSWTDWIIDNAVVTATTLTVFPNSHLLGSAKQMSVRYIVGTLYDEITIVKVSDGADGVNGISIKTIEEQYYLSTSQTTLMGGSWQTTAPKWVSGKFIWTKTVFTYSNDMVEETAPICVTGRDGQNGGVSVSNVDVFYYQSNSATTLTGGSWSTTAPTWTNGKYIWSKTVTYLDNGQTMETDPVCISGQKGTDGKGIKSIANYYLASSSSTGVTASTSGWTTEVQSMSASKKYLWNYERITYTDNSTTNTTPTVIGVFGTNGQDGVGIKSIREYYLATNSASGVTSSTSGWTETVQTPTKDKKYLWNYEVIVYTNNTTYTGTPRIIGNFAQDGANGSSAKSVDIMATNQVFKSKDGGKTYSPDTIVLTPTLQNVTYSNWQYSNDGGKTWKAIASNLGMTVADSTKALTINKNSSAFTDTITSLVFRVNTNDSKYYDTMTVSRLVDATELEIGTVNRALKTSVEKSFTIANQSNYVIHAYDIANDVSGRTVTIAFDYEATNVVKGTNAIVRFQSAWKDPNDKYQFYPSFEFDLPTGNSKGTIVSEPIEFGNFKDGTTAQFRFRFDYISCGFKIKNARVLVGHKDTGWTPAPEDVEESIGNVNNSLSQFQNTVNTTFKDGIIQESEAKAIKQNLKLLDSTKADVDREYATIYENSLLTETYKSNLQSAKSSFDSAHNSLKTTINNSISDGKITSSESTSVDNAFNTYNSALGTYRQRVQQALDYLSTAKINELEIGGTNLIENSAFARGNWEGMSNNTWSIVNAESDKPNCKIAKVSRSGATAVSIKNTYSNFTPCLNGETYMFSMDIKVDNFSAWDVKKPFICEVYNDGKATRVQFMDVDINMCGLTTMSNGKWYRINYKFKVNHVDAKFIRLRLSLFQNGTLYVRCPQIEKGNKASDWSLSPNDIHANIQDVSSELNSFQTNVNGAFKDGIIQQAEAKAIEQHLKILDVEKSDIDKEYTTIYGNSLLSGTAKTNLQSAKTSYDSAHSSLKSTINTVISDGKVTTSEKASVDSTFNTYRSTLGTYKQRVQEALDAISSAKVDNVQIGGANLYRNTKTVSQGDWNNGNSWSVVKLDNGFSAFSRTGTWMGLFQNINYEIGQIYTLSAYVKGSNGAKLNFYFNGAGNTLKTSFGGNEQYIAPSEWTRVWVTFKAGGVDFGKPRFENPVDGGTLQLYAIKLEKGNKASDWSPSEQDMENAYSIILTNEAQVITTNASRVPTASATYYTDIQVYKGTTQRTDYTIGTINSANGITVSKTASRVNFAVATNTALSSDNGSFTIPITIDGKTFNKVFSWSCAKQGNNGANGSDGKGVKSIEEYYAISSSNTQAPTNWSTTVPTMTSTNKYLWNYEVITYTDNSTKSTAKRVIGVYGDKGQNGTNGVNGQDGKGIKSITNYYLATNSSSGVTTSTSGWTTTVQSPTRDKKYLWNYERVTYTDNSTTNTTPCVIGNFAQDGMNGSNGTNGADAYTVILSNENHTFPCESNGNIPTAIKATTNVIAYKGATSVTPTIGNLPTVNGLTLSKSGTTVTIQANTGTALASSGSLTIPVTVDGKNFNKVFSWSKAFKGANGASGSHAKSADIVSTSQVFKSTDGGVTFSPDNITLTPILQNVSFSRWQYSTNGGSSWSNVSSGQNGLTISGNNLVINKGSNLYTTSVTSVTFKLITSDSNIYDTMTIVKLYDVTELEIGGTNLVLNSDFKNGATKWNGVSSSWKIHDTIKYKSKNVISISRSGLTGDAWAELLSNSVEVKVGEKYTMSVDVKWSDIPSNENSSIFIWGYKADGSSRKDVAQYSLTGSKDWSRVSLTGTVPSGVDIIRACFTHRRNGSIYATNFKLERGTKATDWSPAPEDGTDYTDKLIDDLRKLDLKQITDQNQESSDMIANILNDSLIMPHEKTSLKFEFERIKILKENAINYYNTVNDTSFQQLRNAMNTAYTNVENMINPILTNMTQTSNASSSAVHTTFQTFYTAYETLMTALQQSVIILATKHSTKLEQLDKEITMTASKAEIMQDKVNQFDAHMRFSADGFVEIFATENGKKGRFSTQITNKKLSFKDNDVEVAYVSNQELNINKAVINDTMKIGKFAIKPSGSSTGGIVFAYEG